MENANPSKSYAMVTLMLYLHCIFGVFNLIMPVEAI